MLRTLAASYSPAKSVITGGLTWPPARHSLSALTHYCTTLHALLSSPPESTLYQSAAPSDPTLSHNSNNLIKTLSPLVKSNQVQTRQNFQAGEIICVDDPVCSMLCPDDKKGVTSHCNSCFRHTRAPLPCDVSGSPILLHCHSKPRPKQTLRGGKQMCWQQSGRQLCWAVINGSRPVPLIFIIPITDLLQRGVLLKEMQILGHRRLSQV